MQAKLSSAFRLFASLRLTVVLFALSMFIVLAGTLAQIDKGIWTVVDEYFRCAVAWIDLQIFFPRDWGVSGRFPFPGGWAIGTLLLVNILSAHAVRFKLAAHGPRLGVGLVTIGLGAFVTWLVIIGAFDKDIAATEEDAFWRVLLRLGKGGGAALVLWAGCVLLFKRRAGIVLLHGGIILLLVSEIVTGTSAVEGRMRILAGQSKNYVEHTRHMELVLTDRSDPQFDSVLAIPGKLLHKPGLIQRDDLPVDIEVVRYMKNSQLLDLTRGTSAEPNPATAGNGLRFVGVERPEVSGTDTDQGIDVPTAYVKFRAKGQAQWMGTYLVSLWLDGAGLPPQTIDVGAKSYELMLRFARSYKPYEIHLLEFRHDKYMGTQKAKNFSSLVRVVDRAKGVDRTVKIWMNNPLRYAGETFYQSSFEPGKNLTILQVVRNDGWMLPYLSCMIVGVGLTAHMGSTLFGFLRRRVPL